MSHKDKIDLVRKAVAIAGSQNKLAGLCGVSAVAVGKWLRNGQVSAASAVAIDKATNGAVGKEEILPHIFGAAS